MASLKYYNSIGVLFMMNGVYLFFLFSFCYTSQIKSRTYYHTLVLSQHSELSPCINSSITTTGKDSATAVLEVFHKQSLCVDAANGATSSSAATEKILRGDQLRVKHLRHKIMNTNIHAADRSDDLPFESGYNIDTANYVVRIGFGTPARKLHLIFDTGSDLTWTQCLPCHPHCYKQRDRTFNPRDSTSYSNISCADRECSQSVFSCHNKRARPCYYSMLYGDRTYTEGVLAKDKLTFTRNDVFPNFTFGCGQNNTALFGETARLLGLIRGRLSLLSQTAKIYGQYFSYFLPSDPRSTGRLTFGRNINNTKKDLKFTSLIYLPQSPYLYFIKITSITVGSKRLPIPPSVFKNSKNIIDSVTVITRLPLRAYVAMRDEFKSQMNTKRFPMAPAFTIMDTCFRYHKGKSIVFPTISFTFEGNATIELDPYGTLYVVNSSVACLGFCDNGGDDDDLSVLGNMQQLNMEVVYDVAGKKLGFGVPAAG